jgi:type IV pilus assembly protein PilY1
MTRNRIPLRTAFAATACALLGPAAVAAPLAVSEVPLFVASALKPNVMLMIANSNSMDEDAAGLAVGSADPTSRSEIARRTGIKLVENYGGALNMGLMAFQQNLAGGDAVRLYNLHSSPYDISFDPASYNPAYTGDRDSPTKRFREPNASWLGHYIHFNVNLPFYSAVDQGNAFCYSPTANAFDNGEDPVAGPWDDYRCFRVKESDSDALPSTPAEEAANGWSDNFLNSVFKPTDSDLGQGIVDFGRFLAWRWVSQTWFSNGSPGGGYVHVPIADVDPAQASRINTKLGTSQFSVNGPVNPSLPLQNAGLTPLEGTLYTIRDYFAGGIADADRGGPLPPPPNSCGRNYSVTVTNGLPSVTRTGTPSSDVTSMLAAAATAASAARTAGVQNYLVGFALPFGVNPEQLDTIAAAGGTGRSYYATDEAELITELNSVFNDILQRSGAAGAVALNSGSIQTNSRLFQAKFNTGDWSGQLQAFPINAGTGTIGPALWDAGQLLNAQDWNTGRTILSWNPQSAQPIAFRWPANPAAPAANEMSPAQVLALDTDASSNVDGRGALRLQYLRGSATNEGNGEFDFRRRNASRLGDIVNSSPVYVTGPSRNLMDPSYVAFKAAYGGRQAMIYVGSNDGMLHGFNADTGQELMAYVPAAVYGRLSGLTAQGYSHRYTVDGSPVAADIRLGTGWRTLLVGGLGGGGRGLFALDVTDPTRFREASPGSTVLWEYTSANDADLGLTYAQATIIQLNNGQPGVIVGNGYNNMGSGRAALFILNAQTGALIRKITVPAGTTGTPNGMSTPAVVDNDGNGTADYVFAGDLYGNVWKFDLTASSSGSWSLAYGGPVFTATDALGNPQPITAGLEVTRHPQGGFMLLFGTGRYIQLADVANPAVQSLYGIRDTGTGVAGRASLQAQTVIDTQVAGGRTYRAVSNSIVNYPSQRGWYLDLPITGERVVVDPILRNGRMIVPTTIPNPDPCAAGGTSWLLELDYLNGGRVQKPLLDVNASGSIDFSDVVAFSVGSLPASGVRIDAIASSPSVVRGFGDDGSLENKYMNQSDGSIARVLEAGEPLANRRTSWRQIY